MTQQDSTADGQPTVGRGTQRRQRLLDAAVEVVATSGLRGLTHRAVDGQAGLPEGTTSAYFRTRLALLSALTDHVAAICSDDVDRLQKALVGREGDHEYAIAQTEGLVDSWLTDPTVLATRLELGIEAARQSELAETLTPWREHLLDVVQERMCAAGLKDARLRAQATVAALDGIMLSALGTPEPERRAQAMEGTRLLLRSLLGDEPDRGR